MGNSFGLPGFGASGNGADGVGEMLQNLAVSPDGIALPSAQWEENNHDMNVVNPNNGDYLGPFTDTRNGPGAGGILGTAADSQYVYYASGNGLVQRSSRASWLAPSNTTWFDNGSQTGVGPLSVTSHALLARTLCDGQLYVSDGTTIWIVPTSLAGIQGSFSAANVRVLTCDKEGDIWALIAPSGSRQAKRFSPTGTLLSTISLPASITGLAADPTQDQLLTADDGQDQNFKWYDYAGNQTGQIGVTGGYLQGSDPGLIGPGRAVGPHSVAIDPGGNIYTGENCNPGHPDSWSGGGTCGILTKYKPDGATVVYRGFNTGTFGGQGEPTTDGTTFFLRDFEFKRDGKGNISHMPSPSTRSAARPIRGSGPPATRMVLRPTPMRRTATATSRPRTRHPPTSSTCSSRTARFSSRLRSSPRTPRTSGWTPVTTCGRSRTTRTM